MTSRSQLQLQNIRSAAIIAGLSGAATMALWAGSALLPGASATAEWQLPGREAALAIHVGSALLAIPLGAYVLWERKGDARHRTLGRAWAALMTIIAASTFWLRSLSGGFSLIHLLSIVTLVSVPLGIFHAWRGAIECHRRTMRNLYIGLLVAGVLAFLPGRLLGTVLFG